ncbi:IS3 family transposase [Streptomyces sp. OV198]|uniref:IS3 family transposase n=1 Tax=Streptomyces sp. OV198 TaxID=1882787 RepID=UPI00359C20E1
MQRGDESASCKPSSRSSARSPSSSARPSRPQKALPGIDRPVDAGAPVDRCCRILGVARQNYYKHKRTPTTPRQLRREGLTGLIREVHVASRGTYGYRRVHAELSEIRQRRRRGRAFPLERGHPDAPGPQAVERGQ